MRRIFSSWSGRTFEALSHRHFRILFAGTLFATTAYMMMFVAMSIVAFDLGGTNTAVGFVGMGTGISMLLGGPIGGAVADRVNRKRLIVIGQGAGAAILVLTGALLALDVLTLPLFFLLTLVLGATFVFMGPARNAFTRDIVGPRLIGNAVALNQLAHTWGQPFAPLIAAVLIDSAVGGGGTYIAMGSLVSIGVVTMALMPDRQAPDDGPKRSLVSDLAAGARYVFQRPDLRLMLLLFASTVVLGFMFRVLTPALLVLHLDRSATDMGLMMLVNGLAAAAVALLVAGLATSRWSWPLILSLMCLMGLGYLVMSQAQTYGAAVASMALLGPGLQGPVLLLQAKIVMSTEPAYLGRVTAFSMMSFGLSSLLGMPAGIAADALGEREVLTGVGLLTFVIVALGVVGWMAWGRNSSAIAPDLATTPDLRGAALPAAVGALPPPVGLRPTALMSAQKSDN